MKSELNGLDFNLLKGLNALLDERSVTRAAAKLSISQPALSLMLTRLRDHFDDPLFIRGNRGMLPTNRALELAIPVRQILSAIASLSQPTHFDPLTAKFDFILAATDYALKATVLPFMSVLKKASPGIRLGVVPVDLDRLSSQFERAKIDLAIIQQDTSPNELRSCHLYAEKYVCMLRADHPIAKRNSLSLRDFCELEHVIVSPDGAFADYIDERLEAEGRHRHVALAVNSHTVLPDILRITDMIAVIPYRLTCAYDYLVRFDLPVTIQGFEIAMSWHERSHRDPAHQWIRELFLDFCRQRESQSVLKIS